MATERVFVVALADDLFGLPVESVERVLTEQPLTPTMPSREDVIGMFEDRGDLVSVVDLRKLLHVEARAERGHFVRLSGHGGSVAVRVDRLVGIVDLEPGSVQPCPFIAQGAAGLVTGVGRLNNALVVLLDPQGLFPNEASLAA